MALSMAAQAGWSGDGWYAYEWPDGDMHVERIQVLTKRGAVRKAPRGEYLRYSHDRDNNVHKLNIRVFN